MAPVVQEELQVDGVKSGQTIIVTGRTNASAQRFTVNLKCGTADGADIPFHFDVRIYRRVLVLNTFKGHKWGSEKRYKTTFPFSANQDFQLEIGVEPDRYEISGLGCEWNYEHRLAPTSVTYINVTGDCYVTELSVK